MPKIDQESGIKTALLYNFHKLGEIDYVCPDASKHEIYQGGRPDGLESCIPYAFS